MKILGKSFPINNIMEISNQFYRNFLENFKEVLENIKDVSKKFWENSNLLKF